MKESAATYLRQGQAFLAAGEPARAVELLERARVLARDDRALLGPVLESLAEAYDATGRHDLAGRCLQSLQRLGPAAAPVAARPARGPSAPAREPVDHGPRAVHAPARTPILLGAVAAGVAAAMAGAVVAVVLLVMRDREPARPPAAPAGSSSVAIAAAPAPEAPPAMLAPIASPPAPPAVAGAAASVQAIAPPATAPAIDARRQLLAETVGLLVVQARYEGPSGDGKTIRIDVPIATGAAFVVDPSGILLTNRHVVDAAEDDEPPATLAEAGLPRVILRQSGYVVCFGPDANGRFEAAVIHRSERYDLAVLKIDRRSRSLPLAADPAGLGDDVLACGFADSVRAAVDQSADPPPRVSERVRRWVAAGRLDPFETFTVDSFQVAPAGGIISAAERNIGGIGYAQTDAAVHPGSSGGPLLNDRDEVVGMMTLGITAGTGAHHFALLPGQFRDEVQAVINTTRGLP